MPGRIELRACEAEQLLAMIEGGERGGGGGGGGGDGGDGGGGVGRGGPKTADGLREFYVSGDVSPVWLAALRESSGTDPWRHGFFVALRDVDLIIGTAGFKGPPDASGVVEIAYGIAPGYQGRGFATEAAEALVRFASADPRVRVVRAHTLPEANASTRVLRKCGFQHVGDVVDPEDGPVWRWERSPSIFDPP